MSGQLEKCLSIQQHKTAQWLGGDLVQGDPRVDGAIELLLRQGVPTNGRLAFVNLGCGAWLSTWDSSRAKEDTAEAVHLFVEDHVAFERNTKDAGLSGVGSRLATVTGADDLWGEVDGVVLRIFRDMAWNWQWIRRILPRLRPSASLHLIGRKDDGIHSLEKHLGMIGAVECVALGCHSRWLRIDAIANVDALPGGAVDPVRTICTPQGAFSLWCPEGVFASGRLDGGSELLLNNIPNLKGLSVWDFGCGAGVIARSALELGAEQVYASDHSLWAVEACRRNLGEFATRVQVEAHFLGDGVPRMFDRILTNPPFHLEGRELREFGRVWLAACLQHLQPGGEIWLVANGFLPYGIFGAELGLQGTILAEQRGFKVWSFCRKVPGIKDMGQIRS